MATSVFCCAVPRSHVPQEESSLRISDEAGECFPLQLRDGCLDEACSSTSTTVCTEELPDVKSIFEGASCSMQESTERKKRSYSIFDFRAFSFRPQQAEKSHRSRFIKKLSEKLRWSNPSHFRQKKNTGSAERLQSLKAHLQKDLLSDEGPENGGYDRDAEILCEESQSDFPEDSDVLSRLLPLKGRKDACRAHIKSIEWTDYSKGSQVLNA